MIASLTLEYQQFVEIKISYVHELVSMLKQNHQYDTNCLKSMVLNIL